MRETFYLPCDIGGCEAPEGAREKTNCVHCGGELHQHQGWWYCWEDDHFEFPQDPVDVRED